MKDDLERLLSDALNLQQFEKGGVATSRNKRFLHFCERVMKHTGGNPFFVETVSLRSF